MPLAISWGCTAWFVSDLVGNPEYMLPGNAAQIISFPWELFFFDLGEINKTNPLCEFESLFQKSWIQPWKSVFSLYSLNFKQTLNANMPI